MEGSLQGSPAWPRQRRVALGATVLLVMLALLISLWLEAKLDLMADEYEYDIVEWEVRHFSNKLLFEIGSLLRDGLSSTDEDAIIRRFLELNGEIDDLEEQQSDAAQRSLTADAARTRMLAELQRERDTIENRVEDAIERRITAVLEDEGIELSLPALPGFVWPPVDFEPTYSPRSLAISYRDRIELKGTELLRAGLDLATVEHIEDARLVEGESALAFSTAGVGAYPSIVGYTTSYHRLLEVVAHEWTHNYLVFRPLGLNYYQSYDLRALNETVADRVGQEVAQAVLTRWPLLQRETPAPPAEPSEAEPSDFDVIAELRKLREEVDALLAQGKIEAAEALMEQRRQELNARGASIRKLNQAYFAFTNLYAGEAGNPVATNPIGPKVDELRRRSASLHDFLRTAGGFNSIADLDRALAAAD
jgi:hypothetical protein